MTTTPTITALAPWFGSKRTLAPRIVEQLGPHRVFWEPFCGSLAVLFAKPPCTMETVNDLHGDLINLARVVQSDELAPRLQDHMRRTLMHEVVMEEAAERYRARGNVPATADPDLERAADFLLCSWLGRNGLAGTESYHQGFSVRYTANGGHAAKRFYSVVESIPVWWERLRNVTILNRDARELLARIEDKEGTAIYLDPPYVEKGATYVHDFAGARKSRRSLFSTPKADAPMSHEELAGLAGRFTQARVVVSYYDHPMIRRLYDGWTFISCPTTKALVNQGMQMKNRGGKAEQAPEVLIVNGEERAT